MILVGRILQKVVLVAVKELDLDYLTLIREPCGILATYMPVFIVT